MSTLGYVEAHPYLTAGGVFVGGVGLYLLFRKPAQAGHAASAPSGYDPGYNAAVVAANAGIMQAQLAVNAHAADTVASLNAHISDNNAALSIAGLSAQVASNKTNVAGSVASQSIAAGIAGQRLTNAHDIAIAGMSRDVALQAGLYQDNANARLTGLDAMAITAQAARDAQKTGLGAMAITAQAAQDGRNFQLAQSGQYQNFTLAQQKLGLADVFNARAGGLADALDARHVNLGLVQISSAQQTNSDNNARMLAARTIQTGADVAIGQGVNDGAYNTAKLQTDAQIKINESNNNLAGNNAILGTIAGIL